MGTGIKHPVLDRFKLSFVIFDIRALQRQSAGMSKIKDDGIKRFTFFVNYFVTFFLRV